LPSLVAGRQRIQRHDPAAVRHPGSRMIEAAAWLPPGALRDGALTAVVAETARAWCARWWGAGKAIDTKLCPSADVHIGATAICREANGLTLSFDEAWRLKIGVALLRLPLPAPKLNDADLTLCHGIADAGVRDLLDALGAALLRQSGAAEPS